MPWLLGIMGKDSHCTESNVQVYEQTQAACAVVVQNTSITWGLYGLAAGILISCLVAFVGLRRSNG